MSGLPENARPSLETTELGEGRDTTSIPTRPALLTKRDAAARLAMSVRWLEQRARDGAIPVVRFGRAVRFLASDVDALAAAHREGGGD